MLSMNLLIAVYFSHLLVFSYRILRLSRESFILLGYHQKNWNFLSTTKNLSDIKTFVVDLVRSWTACFDPFLATVWESEPRAGRGTWESWSRRRFVLDLGVRYSDWLAEISWIVLILGLCIIMISRVLASQLSTTLWREFAKIRGLCGHNPFETSPGIRSSNSRLRGTLILGEDKNMSDQRRSSQRGPLINVENRIYSQENLEWPIYYLFCDAHASGGNPHNPFFTLPLLAPIPFATGSAWKCCWGV